ncbi:MAG TPA: flagellar basal body P-ring formation chaperone FlgA [bacterium]|jgi:flagella basal body P-ring formation protein FlgA
MKYTEIYRLVLTGSVLVLLLFSGSTRTYATDYQTINSGWLLATAQNIYLTSEPWKSAGCNVEITSTPADATVYRTGQVDVVGKLERTPNGLRDIGAVTVEIFISGELYMRFDPGPYIAVSMNVYKATRDIDREEIIGDGDIELAAVEVRNLPSHEIVMDPGTIIGKAAKVNIQAGRIISEEVIEFPVVVERGESVIVFIQLGAASITMQGIALDSGAVGDEIRVRNPDSDAIITATVTGESRAEVKIL